MSTATRMKQMAHLKQKQISDNSCKAIIIDTLLETVRPLTQTELACEITSLFHILVSAERLAQQIDALSKDGIITFDEEDHIFIAPAKQTEFIIARLQENHLREEATTIWIDDIIATQTVSPELNKYLSQALPVFLRTLFIKHGVLSYELLTSTNDLSIFDLKQISKDVAVQFDESFAPEIEALLPSIFQSLHHAKVIEYLKHSIEKAVGYISEVISDESLSQITNELKELTIYLDTNTIYRLLNLQGNFRYDAIKETLDFCKKHGVKLKVSAITKKELTSRLKFDAKVLTQFPTRTNLAQAGYKYRSSDNYVSTYWLKTQSTNVSVEDYISFYQNFDILLDAEQIEIEEIEVDEEALIDRAKCFYSRMSLHDQQYDKSDFGLWHDAYNFAYVQKMQKADAKNAIDTHCLFLTTDQALMSFQREDHVAKNNPPVVIAPSQLLQMFAFSTADGGYEETFIKFFASSSLGITFKYDNNDIQEILSRLGHYKGVSVEIAERILARQLLDSRYLEASEEEKEEIIYNSISEELLAELNLTREQLILSESSKAQLDEEHKAVLELMNENEEQFTAERTRLQAEIAEADRKRDTEIVARKKAEEAGENVKKYSIAQEKLYADEKISRWIKTRHIMFWSGIVLAVTVIGLSIFLWLYLKDSGCLGLLSALTVPFYLIPKGTAAFSSKAIEEQRQQIIDEYRKKLNQK